LGKRNIYKLIILKETGRYKNIIRSERKCTNCSKGDIEDEKHFIVDCPLYENIKVKFFDKSY
jgi:hypothetical protein